MIFPVQLVQLAQTNLWDRIAAWYQNSVFHDLFRHFADDVFGVELGNYEHLPIAAGSGNVIRGLILALLAGILLAAGAAVYTKKVPGGFIRRLLAMGATDPDHAVTLAETGYFRSFGIRTDLKHGGALAKLVCRPGDDGLTLAGTRPEATEPDGAETGPSLTERLNADAKAGPKTDTVSLSSAETSAESDPGPDGTAGDTDGGNDDSHDSHDSHDNHDSHDSHDNDNEGNEGNEEKKKKGAEPPVLAPVDFLRDRFYVPKDLRIRAELRYEKAGSGIRGFLLTAVVAVAAAILLCRFLPNLLSLADNIVGNI